MVSFDHSQLAAKKTVVVLLIWCLLSLRINGFTTPVSTRTTTTTSLLRTPSAHHRIRDHQRLLRVSQEQPLHNSKEEEVNGSTNTTIKKTPREHYFTKIPRLAIRIYSEYASRLWKETSPLARRKIAKDRVTSTIKQVQHVFRGEEYCDYSNVSSKDRQNLLDACDSILASSEKAKSEKALGGGGEEEDLPNQEEAMTTAVAAKSSSSSSSPTAAVDGTPAAQKKGRSVLFGATMGAAAAGWVFSGNYVFTGVFTLMTILGQLEYYRMVMNTGVYPARRISIIGASSMFLTVRKYLLFVGNGLKLGDDIFNLVH